MTESSPNKILESSTSNELNANNISPEETSDFVEDGKNKLDLWCIHCPSKIMPRLTANFHKEDKDLPKMSQKKSSPELEVDQISEWFMVDDMFLFENIGVSHSVEKTRYLICADCEMGPVGWNDLNNQKCFIALSRVRQCDKLC